jgi:Phage tail protein
MGGDALMSVVLGTPTYSLDGWLGNATDDYGVSWIVTEETGWSDGAPVRLTTSDREGTDGGRSGPVLRGPRLIVLKGKAFAPNQAAMLAAKDRLHTFAAGDPASAYPLVVTEAHLTRQAAVKHFTEPRARDTGSTRFDWEMALRADDPLRYSAGLVVATLELPTDALSGLTFPLTFPLTFSSGNPETNGKVLANLGNAPTLPYVTIGGPVSHPVLQNVATNRQIAFAVTLAANESLDVDFAARTVLLGGANRRLTMQPSSTWWALVPGNNEVRFRATSYTGALATVTYRSAWK